MGVNTASTTLIAAVSRDADFTSEGAVVDPHAESVEMLVILSALARTSTGTLQVRIEVSYDDGATWESPAVMVGAAWTSTTNARERFFMGWDPPRRANLADHAEYYQAGWNASPSAGTARLHSQPDMYRAIADMAGDTTSYTVLVTMRQAVKIS